MEGLEYVRRSAEEQARVQAEAKRQDERLSAERRDAEARDTVASELTSQCETSSALRGSPFRPRPRILLCAGAGGGDSRVGRTLNNLAALHFAQGHCVWCYDLQMSAHP